VTEPGFLANRVRARCSSSPAALRLVGLPLRVLLARFVFAAREEALRRTVVEESKAYNDGMIQDLQRMQFEYIQPTSTTSSGSAL